MKRILITLIFIFIISLSLSGSKQISIETQSKLLVKIITYDKAIDRYGEPIIIGVSSFKMKKALNMLHIKIKGKKFIVKKMNSTEDIKKYKVVYIDYNWQDKYEKIGKIIKKHPCLIFCNDSDLVEAGVGAVSFKTIKDRAKIIVNLGNAKSQGARFVPAFLRITIIIGRVN